MGLLSRIQRAAQAFKVSPAADDAVSAFGASLWTPGMQAEPDQSVLDHIEQTHPVVYRCINVISQDASQIPLKLQRKGRDGSLKDVEEHPALELFTRHINLVEVPTSYWSQHYNDLLREGNHFSYLEQDAGGKPRDLIWIDPKEVQPIPDKNTIISGYTRTTPNGKVRNYGLNQIFHTKTTSTKSRYRGMAPTHRLRDPIAIDQQMVKWRWNFFYNGMPVQILFRTSTKFPTPGARERVVEHLRKQLTGRLNEGQQFAVVDADTWDVTVIPRPKENETAYMEGRKLERQIICMVYGVPPNKVADFTDPTSLANSIEQERLYWEDTIMGWHRLVLDNLNYKFMPMHYSEDRDLQWAYDYSQVKALNSGKVEQSTMMVAEVNAGIRTRNEAREVVGLEQHEDPRADLLSIPPTAAELAAMQEDKDDEAKDDPPKKPEKQIARIVPMPTPMYAKVFDEDLFQTAGEKLRLAKLVDREIRRMVRLAAERQLELAGLSGAFDQTSPAVLEFVRKQIISLVGVVETQNTIVRRAIAEGLQSGIPIVSTEMRALVQQAFREVREPFALHRIARTEVHAAQEGGGFIAAQQAGLEFKRWITARDDRVRGTDPDDSANHLALEAQGAIAMHEAFHDPRSGADLQFPGDREGAVSGGDTINCRCTWIADFEHLENEERAARLTDAGFKFHSDLVTTSLDAAWEMKAAQRARFEAGMRRLLKMYMVGAERRFLARYDAFVDDQRVDGGVLVGR